MSNGRYTLCPFYVDENKNTVSCEDVCRSFDDMDEKWQWMAMYCDDDWMRCPFAADLNEAYYRQEKGDVMALQEHEIKALKSENRSLTTKLGMSKKKCERLQKQLDKEKEINKSWQRQHEEDEKKKKMFFGYWKRAEAELDARSKKAIEELDKLGVIYEQRMCYLIHAFAPGGILSESKVQEWAGDKAFALIHEYDEQEGLIWKVVFEETEDGENDSEGVSGDVEEQPESE